jgi:hypothetical protein
LGRHEFPPPCESDDKTDPSQLLLDEEALAGSKETDGKLVVLTQAYNSFGATPFLSDTKDTPESFDVLFKRLQSFYDNYPYGGVLAVGESETNQQQLTFWLGTVVGLAEIHPKNSSKIVRRSAAWEQRQQAALLMNPSSPAKYTLDVLSAAAVFHNLMDCAPDNAPDETQKKNASNSASCDEMRD